MACLLVASHGLQHLGSPLQGLGADGKILAVEHRLLEELMDSGTVSPGCRR